MKRSTRMLLMAGRDSGRQDGYARDGGSRMEYDRPVYDGGYGPDDRFRDRRGREHYDNGRFAPRNDGGMWVDGRYWDGREAYRSPESHSPMSTPYVPPVYERYPGRESRPMNKIGFALEGEMGRMPPEFGREYRADAGRRERRDETAWRPGEARMGQAAGEEVRPLTRESAMEWTGRMENADGSRGPHWPMEKTEEARTQRGIPCDPLEFYVAMNMMYSDYVKAAEKANCSSMDFYAYMARAFLEDQDAQPEKLARYWRYIAAQS